MVTRDAVLVTEEKKGKGAEGLTYARIGTN